MRSLRMTEERRKILLRAMEDAQGYQKGLRAAYTPEAWNPDPPEFKAMREECTSLIKSYREISGLLFALGEKQ